jgi:hypothetical protein
LTGCLRSNPCVALFLVLRCLNSKIALPSSKICVVRSRTCRGPRTICVSPNHFVSFLPSKIPMEFWNFGILFCKSLISLKKVDSNFTLRIRPLYIKTQKFQFRVSFPPIPKFQLARSSSKQGWNLGIIRFSPTRETLSHRLALTRARRHITGFIGHKKARPILRLVGLCSYFNCA